MLRSMRRTSYLKPYGPVSSGQRPNKFLIPSQSALSTPPHLHSGGSHEYFTQDAWAYLMFIRHRQGLSACDKRREGTASAVPMSCPKRSLQALRCKCPSLLAIVPPSDRIRI